MKTFQVILTNGRQRKVEADRYARGDGGIGFYQVAEWSPRTEQRTDWFNETLVERIQLLPERNE